MATLHCLNQMPLAHQAEQLEPPCRQAPLLLANSLPPLPGRCHIFQVLSSEAVTRMGFVGWRATLATDMRWP
jgi:hypothetical protein